MPPAGAMSGQSLAFYERRMGGVVVEVNRSTVTDFLVEFWTDVDRNEGIGVHHFFAEEGVLGFGDELLVGREAIAQWYRKRTVRGPRLTRHLVTNVRIAPINADTVEVESALVLFRHDGLAPQPTSAPSVTDVRDRLQVTEAGLLIIERSYHSAFV
jgi:hypothetical protein